MDAVKFVKEYLRMCTKFDVCEDCPIYKTDFCTVPAKERSQESAEEIVELVEKWSAAHSRKTRQSVFLTQWPSAVTGDDGVLDIVPCAVEKSMVLQWQDLHRMLSRVLDAGGGVMENLLQNIASGLWIVLGVYCFFGLRKWNKHFSDLYDELKGDVELWND